MVLCVKPANANYVFRALADPTRRGIFEELTRQGEQTVHALHSLFWRVPACCLQTPIGVEEGKVSTASSRGTRKSLSRAARRADADGELAASLRCILA